MEHAQLVLSDDLDAAFERPELERDLPLAPTGGELGRVGPGLKRRDHVPGEP